jgi:hypothetical protein
MALNGNSDRNAPQQHRGGTRFRLARDGGSPPRRSKPSPQIPLSAGHIGEVRMIRPTDDQALPDFENRDRAHGRRRASPGPHAVQELRNHEPAFRRHFRHLEIDAHIGLKQATPETEHGPAAREAARLLELRDDRLVEERREFSRISKTERLYERLHEICGLRGQGRSSSIGYLRLSSGHCDDQPPVHVPLGAQGLGLRGLGEREGFLDRQAESALHEQFGGPPESP